MSGRSISATEARQIAIDVFNQAEKQRKECHEADWTAPMDIAFRFKDWTIRVEQAGGQWRAEAARWLNSDFGTGPSPEAALSSLASKLGWDSGDLEVAWMKES